MDGAQPLLEGRRAHLRGRQHVGARLDVFAVGDTVTIAGPDGNPQVNADGTVENPNSILDSTDLVFIDPVGTGFSRPYTTDAGRQFYGAATVTRHR